MLETEFLTKQLVLLSEEKMGKVGGYKKRDAKTGSQKKLLRMYEKEGKKFAGAREQGVQEYQKMLGPEGLKYLEQFTGPQGAQNYGNALKASQDVLRPILEGQRKEALGQFDRENQANIYGQYGAGSGKNSAYNQALASARTSLEQSLFNRSNEMGLNMANQQQSNSLAAANSLYGFQQNAAANLSGAGLQQGNTAIGTERNLYTPRSTPVVTQVALAGVENVAKNLGQKGGQVAGKAEPLAAGGTG
jgi:hypothetical protein